MRSPFSSSSEGSFSRLVTTFLIASCLSIPAETATARKLMSTSLVSCMKNSGVSATYFNVTFNADTRQLSFQMNGISTIAGNVRARATVRAYGFKVLEQVMDPCSTEGLSGLCPMTQAPLEMQFTQILKEETVKEIPGMAYKIPDLDGIAQLEVLDSNGAHLACVEAPLSNGQTVRQNGVSWASAVTAGGSLLVSALVAGFGHSSTAAHIAANALSLFSYFQSQSIVSMMGVPLPPLVVSWTGNFVWAMGIIRIGFMQKIFHWYIQATGGKPANLLIKQQEVSVQITKRSLDPYLQSRAAMYGFEKLSLLVKRVNNNAIPTEKEIIQVTGIRRMAYKARIEATNVFLTGISFYIAFLVFVFLGIMLFKLACDLMKKRMKAESFREFRSNWQIVLKGIMYRVVLIGFPQMAVICPWEMTQRDSPAAVVLAIFFFAAMFGILAWAASKVVRLAIHSKRVDPNGSLGPAYSLYSDPAALNRYGYLYVQFTKTRFYFIIPVMIYAFTRSLIIALGQDTGKVQACALLATEWLWLIVVCVLRPWLDRRTNIVNIGIAIFNAVNSLFVLFFSGVTGSPEPVVGVMGVIFFVANAAFALILLILVTVTTLLAIFSRNPEARFQTVTPVNAPGVEKSSSSTAGSAAPIRDLDADDTTTRRASSEADLSQRRSLSSRNGTMKSQKSARSPLYQHQDVDSISLREEAGRGGFYDTHPGAYPPVPTPAGNSDRGMRYPNAQQQGNGGYPAPGGDGNGWYAGAGGYQQRPLPQQQQPRRGPQEGKFRERGPPGGGGWAPQQPPQQQQHYPQHQRQYHDPQQRMHPAYRPRQAPPGRGGWGGRGRGRGGEWGGERGGYGRGSRGLPPRTWNGYGYDERI